MPDAPNLFSGIPNLLPEELFTPLLQRPGVRVQRIVSHGHASPEGFWYDQPEDEWVLLVRGAARLRFEGEQPIELIAGSYVNVPARKRHRVDWTTPDGPTVWLAMHYGATSDPPLAPLLGGEGS